MPQRRDGILLVNSPLPPEMLPLSLAIIGAFILLALANWRAMVRTWTLRITMIAGYIFLVFGHAYNAHRGHPWYFFSLLPAAIGLLALFASPALRRWTAGVFVVALVLDVSSRSTALQQPVSGDQARQLQYATMAVTGNPIFRITPTQDTGFTAKHPRHYRRRQCGCSHGKSPLYFNDPQTILASGAELHNL